MAISTKSEVMDDGATDGTAQRRTFGISAAVHHGMLPIRASIPIIGLGRLNINAAPKEQECDFV